MFGGLVLGRRTASQRDAAGLTLLELLAVLALVALLAGLGWGGARRAVESARTARARAELATLAAALDAYRRGFGDFPRTDDPAELLQALLGRRDPAGGRLAARPVLALAGLSTSGGRDPHVEPTAVLVDPWGEPYRYAYRVPVTGWTNSRFVLYSAGPDGAHEAALLAGGYADMSAPTNADNVFAPP